MPNPANPQSLNRYSYVLNSPLSRIDPSGHEDIACPDDNCSPVPEPPDPLVDFDTEGDEEWTDDEKATIQEAAADVAGTLAAAYNRDQRELWRMGMIDEYKPITAREAWFSVYGGTVTFKRVTATCARCWGETQSANLIHVFSNATATSVANTPNFVVHELGHAFENAVEAAVGSKLPSGSFASHIAIVRSGRNSIIDGYHKGFEESMVPK